VALLDPKVSVELKRNLQKRADQKQPNDEDHTAPHEAVRHTADPSVVKAKPTPRGWARYENASDSVARLDEFARSAGR